MFKVLVADKMADEGLQVLRDHAQFEVDIKLKLSPEELVAAIPEYDVLLVRSDTKATPAVIEAGKKLKVIGRAGVGLDNVDIDAATRRGIIVMNTPGGNTIATAEQTMTLILALSRCLVPAANSLAEGNWERSAFKGTELYGKTIGIIGLGRIGTEVAKRCASFGMTVIGNDPFIDEDRARRIGVTPTSLEEIYKTADYITVHTPKTAETLNLIGEKEIAMMKKSVRLINCARGGIISEEALAKALEEGKVAGAAVDVYSKEPPEPTNPILKAPNCLCAPHLGASTKEAQVNVAIEVCEQVVDALTGKGVRNAANIPYVDPDLLETMTPYLRLAEKMGLLASQIKRGAPQKITATFSGPVADLEVKSLTSAMLVGIFQPHLEYSINMVNAPVIAKERGVQITEQKSTDTRDYADLIQLTLCTSDGDVSLDGTVFAKNDARIVRIDGYHVDARPYGQMVLLRNKDLPGVIGSVGAILGKHKINISDMTLGRIDRGGEAVTVLNVDEVVPEDALKDIGKIPSVLKVQQLRLG